MNVEQVEHTDAGRTWPALLWHAPPGWRSISTAVLGGGISQLQWWLNAKVRLDYDHPDPVQHLREVAAGLGLVGPGVGMLTAADVTRAVQADDEDVEVTATVGLGLPVWAAAPPEVIAAEHYETPQRVGTINILVAVPVALSDAALVNAVLTATEAKTQALVEAGVDGSGTSSDAIVVACPLETAAGQQGEVYGGPRSVWGARIARAVHRAVAEGTADWNRLHGR